MNRRRGRLQKLIPVVGHVHKKVTSEKWARQYCRRGRGQIIDGTLYCFRSGLSDGSNLARILPPRPVDPAQVNGEKMEWRVQSSDGFMVLQGECGAQ